MGVRARARVKVRAQGCALTSCALAGVSIRPSLAQRRDHGHMPHLRCEVQGGALREGVGMVDQGAAVAQQGAHLGEGEG